jgi:hypothetical protein
MFLFAMSGLRGLSSEEEATGHAADGEPVSGHLGTAERRRICRVLEALVQDTMPGLPAIHRVGILGLVLLGVQAEIWDDPLGDEGWFPVVAEALKHLDADDIPQQMSSSAASWAATAVYLMHEHRPTAGRPAELLLYERAAASVSHLFPDADPDVVADLAEPLTNKNGFPVDPDAVMDLISMIVQEDPLAEAIDTLEDNHPSWTVHKHGDRLLHVAADFRATFLPAAEALDAIQSSGAVAVLTTGSAAAGHWLSVTETRSSGLTRTPRTRTPRIR